MKYLEIRDSATFIPCCAFKFNSQDEPSRFLLARAGYGISKPQQNSYVLLMKLGGDQPRVNHDPYEWGGGARTMKTAHDYIIKNYDALINGDVIDVEYILGETKSLKISERFDSFGE
jgi:hypothetical protein